MKKLFTIFSFLCFGSVYAQTTIYFQNFNTGSASDWALNTADLGGDVSGADNVWIINNSYSPGTLGTATPHEPSAIIGSPTSYYLHIYSSALSSLYGTNDVYNSSGSGLTYFVAQNTPVSTVGYTNVKFSFWWICNGDALSSGKVYYRTSSTGTWNPITTPLATFYGSSTWNKDSVHLSAFDGQAFLEFGFQFTDGDASGGDPSFGIDDIKIYVDSTSTGSRPVASFTSSTTSTCQDSCITFTSTTTGTVDSLRWVVLPATGTSTSSSFIQCFTTPGTYTVYLLAYNTSGGDTTLPTTVTIYPTPAPVVHKSHDTLSVTGTYTSYQWMLGGIAITGATNSMYIETTPGSYTIMVDSVGCLGTSSALSTTGVNDMASISNNCTITNNGNTATLNATFPLMEQLNVAVADLTGRVIYNDTWAAGSLNKQLSIGNLATGIYIIKVYSNSTSQILKWMK